MATWKKFIQDYFSFTRKERIGVIFLISLIIFVLLAPKLLKKHQSYTNRTTGDTSWFATVRKLISTTDSPGSSMTAETQADPRLYEFDRSDPAVPPRLSLFYFDPNTLDDDGWRKLGLPNRTIQTIRNYLSKGGRFRKPADLARVYGIRKTEFDQLKPFILIRQTPRSLQTPTDSIRPIFSKRTFSLVDINTADTSTLIALPGIGSKLAARIVNFREKLGGFHQIDQVRETYGLADSVFQKIKPHLSITNPVIRQININSAGIDELRNHPYIRSVIGNAVINYRNQHGPFSKVEDLLKVMAISEETFRKVRPYFTLEN
jgi:competence protein ComEA